MSKATALVVTIIDNCLFLNVNQDIDRYKAIGILTEAIATIQETSTTHVLVDDNILPVVMTIDVEMGEFIVKKLLHPDYQEENQC
jgi:hypothetical protein